MGYPVRKALVLPHLPSTLHLDRVTRQQAGAVAALALGGILVYVLMRKRESPDEIELQRRTLLARSGRIIDGTIVGIDGRTEDTTGLEMPQDQLSPQMLLYSYRIAGVSYECAQDVTSLAEQVRHLRIDLPVQVRYDPRNPGNSIIVAESWNGVRLDAPQLHTLEEPHHHD